MAIGTITNGASATLNLAQECFADKESFLKVLGHNPVMQARFAQYLMQVSATKKLKGIQFVAGQVGHGL